MSTFTPQQLLKNRYRLRKVIGQGGFSVVWLAVDEERFDSTVAVKVIAPDGGLDDLTLFDFEQEFRVANSLAHAGLLRSTDHFMHEDSPCMVFEFMSGGSLFQRMESEVAFSEREIAKVMAQMGDALQYLHRQKTPILHLDFKPDNVLINYSQNYVLSDFGISQQLRNTLLSAANVRAVTEQYAAPEMLDVSSKTPLTAKADIFSLGVTLVELCNGLLDTRIKLGHEVLSGLPKPKINTQVYSGRLEKWVHACLELDPEKRPSAAQLARAGQHFLENDYWEDLDQPGKEIPIVQPKRSSKLAIAAAFLMLFGTCFGVKKYFFDNRHGQEMAQGQESSPSKPATPVPVENMAMTPGIPKKWSGILLGRFAIQTDAEKKRQAFNACSGVKKAKIQTNQVEFFVYLDSFPNLQEVQVFKNEQPLCLSDFEGMAGFGEVFSLKKLPWRKIVQKEEVKPPPPVSVGKGLPSGLTPVQKPLAPTKPGGADSQKFTCVGLNGENYNGPGVRIIDFIENSAAQEAGLLKSDLITGFDGTKVKNYDHFRELVRSKKSGVRVEIEFLRNGHSKKTTITLKLCG